MNATDFLSQGRAGTNRCFAIFYCVCKVDCKCAANAFVQGCYCNSDDCIPRSPRIVVQSDIAIRNNAKVNTNLVKEAFKSSKALGLIKAVASKSLE